LVACLLAVAATSACLFDTREPQKADDDTTNYIPLTDPQQVFVAIRESINDTQTDANYENAVSDRFIFSPSLQDSLDQNFIGTGVYDNWGKQKELDVLNRLLADSDYLRVDFTPSIEINQNTFVRFRVEYDLDATNVSAPLDTLRYKGVAFFDVRRRDGNWRLEYWDEIEGVAGFASWGYLKGVLGLGL
jgi:hypothetical protein